MIDIVEVLAPSPDERLIISDHRPLMFDPLRLPDGPVLITGADGSIGAALAQVLDAAGVMHVRTDVATMDVTSQSEVRRVMLEHRPGTVLHMAGAKHAPDGELDPMECVRVNTLGTQHVLAEAEMSGARVVTASTCKACDPETAYGASKLLAERLTLNASQRVARFHNVVESAGNVFEIWRNLPPDARLPVAMGTTRKFISLAQAVSVVLFAATAPNAGRYGWSEPIGWSSGRLVRMLHPGRDTQVVERRGDRRGEPLTALCERRHAMPDPRFVQIVAPHDAPVPVGVPA